jgi:PAS domain S-box-containing protein
MVNNSLDKLEASINFVANKREYTSGIDFLNILAKFIGDLLQVDYVLIDKYSKENPDVAETVAIYTANGLAPNIVYDLLDSPCQNVIDCKLCAYDSNIQQLFPKDDLLVQMQVDSYVGIPLWGNKGEPIGLIAVMDGEKLDDIKSIELILKTVSSIAAIELERILYTNKLKISEDRFSLLLESSEDIITIHEPNGKYLYYNGPSCYAITPKDIVGKTPTDIFNQEASEGLLNAFKKVEETGKSETIEVLLDWLGEKRWFSEYIYPVKNAKGEIIEMVKVCRDIHQRKIGEQEIETQNKALLESEKELQATVEEYHSLNEELNHINEELRVAKDQIQESEIKFRAIFNHSTDALGVSRNGVGILFNPAYLKLFGYTNSEQLKGKSIIEQIAIRERDRIYNYINDRTLGIKVPNSYESVGLKKNGEEFDFEIEISRYILNREEYTLVIIRDVTQRKIAEEELRKSEEKLDLFFLQSLDGFFFMMLDEPVEWNESIDKEKTLEYVFSHQRITRVNDSMLKQYLATHEQFMNLTPNDFFTDNLDYGKKVWREFFDSGKLHIETNEKKFDGSDMFIEGDYICMYDLENRITGHFGIQRDITERKHAEQELQTSNEEYQALNEELNQKNEEFFALLKGNEKQTEKLKELYNTLNQAQKLSHIGNWHWNMATDEAEWSDEMYNIYGVNKVDFYPSNENVAKTVLPEDIYKVEQGIGLLLNDEMFTPFEFRIKRPSGEIRDLYIIALEKGESGSGNDNVVFGVTQDITERKKEEKSSHQFAQIASNSTDMIFLVNSDYQYQAANNSYLNAFKLSKEEIVGRKLFEVMGEAYFKNTIKPNIKKCLNGEKILYQAWFDFPELGKRYMDIKYSQYLENDGVLKGIVVNARDITFRKQAEDKIQKSLEEKELLLRELYHRTKNNMQVISSMLSIKSMYTDNKEVKETFEETKRRIMSMALVHEKLYQAKDLSWIDLKDYITDLVELLKASLLPENTNLEIITHLENTRTNIDTAIPCGLIINELFTNAIKHGFPDNKSGFIKIELTNQDDNEICISISDNGKGIPEGLDFKNSKSYGLEAVVMLAELQLGGSIILNSKKGTEFKVTFKETIKADRI